MRTSVRRGDADLLYIVADQANLGVVDILVLFKTSWNPI
jgi:hypothetical protein